jgi:cytochrome c-type biogenesis protein
MTAITEFVAQLGFAATLGGFTFFAPCAFPLLPGYLAFFVGATEAERVGTRRRLWRSTKVALFASAGFFVVFWLLGGVVALAGTRVLADVGLLELVVGSLLIVLGVGMATGRTPQWHVRLPERRRTAGGFFLFGVVYAVAAAGCTAPLFIGVVGASISAGPTLGGATLLAYATGMSATMVAITGLAALGRGQLLRRLSTATGSIQRVAGALLALAGVVQIAYYLFWLGGWQVLAG